MSIQLLLKCNEANHICDKNQYKEATLWEKTKLTFHLMRCAICRAYTRKNVKLTRAIRVSHLQTMPQNYKAAMKAQFQKEIDASN